MILDCKACAYSNKVISAMCMKTVVLFLANNLLAPDGDIWKITIQKPSWDICFS